MLTVGICLFDEVEVLDFAGAFEVFSLAENENAEKIFKVVTISQNPTPIHARNGLQVITDYQFDNHPPLDILVIPGGYGAEQIEINNPLMLRIANQSSKVKQLLSICTGVFLLAENGLLDHQRATTHWMDIERLRKDYPNVQVIANQRYVDEGHIITSGGISSGIHASLYTVAKFSSPTIANQTAHRMEFDFKLAE